MVEICQTPLLPPSAKCRRSPWDQTLTLIVPSHNEYWLCVLRRGILWWQNCITRFCTCVGCMDITFDKIRTIMYKTHSRYVQDTYYSLLQDFAYVGWMDITFDNHITYKICTIMYKTRTRYVQDTYYGVLQDFAHVGWMDYIWQPYYVYVRYVLQCVARFCTCGVRGLGRMTAPTILGRRRIAPTCIILPEPHTNEHWWRWWWQYFGYKY